ncbi:uncharacterized protein LOC5515721 isoform X2 [Nematostella vectensis]|uniref:uncharacterized protein LOC5515721 isoform X2 n=1 Tax=Nematostella vectensis TaxID=45351 RepID=UPI002077541C|nr:uncharacterized protein LOC5515721 isoform X2 [Nematostella vectensis]
MEKSEVLISEGNGLMSVKHLEESLKAVCFIQAVIRDNVTKKERLRRGSGFYASVNVMGIQHFGIFTNNHVIEADHEAQMAEAIFGYNSNGEGRSVRLDPQIIFRTNKDLDYTFIGVNKSDLDSLAIIPIRFLPEPVTVRQGDEVFIFQHPKGRPKEFSHEKILHIERPFVYYRADTETGSSGSPVLWKLKLLAVHQKGSDELNYNKGTLCSEIISHLNNGKYTQPQMVMLSDSQDREIDEDLPSPAKRQRMQQGNQYLPGSPSEEELDSLAKEIVKDWKHLGRKLKVPNCTIEEISRDHVHYQGMREKGFQMLVSWKDSELFSYETLGIALKAMDKHQLARKYCMMKK